MNADLATNRTCPNRCPETGITASAATNKEIALIEQCSDGHVVLLPAIPIIIVVSVVRRLWDGRCGVRAALAMEVHRQRSSWSAHPLLIIELGIRLSAVLERRGEHVDGHGS